MSETSKLSAISSKLDDVAFSICSSRAELDANQLAMVRRDISKYKEVPVALKRYLQFCIPSNLVLRELER